MYRVWLELLKPDRFRSDWYSEATNQAGHYAMIGGFLTFVLLFAGLSLPAIPITAAVIYFILWEMMIQRSDDLGDKLMDTFNVHAGSATLISMAIDWKLSLTCFIIWVALIALGVKRRLNNVG